MSGRWLIGLMLAFALIFGAALWYFQNYAYYYPLTLAEPEATAAVAPEIQPQPASPTETVAAKLPENTEIAALPRDAAADTARDSSVPLDHPVALYLTRVMDGAPEVISAKDFKGIDADTSPLKFKACFKTAYSIPLLTETYVVYDDPTPLKAPGWFRCFDQGQLADDLVNGTAIAFLGQANIQYGVDRVIAVYDDGRSYAWNQFNACGEAAFSGEPAPQDCPKNPER